MKRTYILLVAMLMCSIGTASAGNDTSVNAAKIVDMEQVKKSAADTWKDANEDGNAGYLIIGLAMLAWIVIAIIMLMVGASIKATGKQMDDANKTNQGTKMINGAIVSIIVVPIALVVMSIFLGIL